MDCSFHLNTYINGYIVSTVGEYRPANVYERGAMRARRDADPPERLGGGPESLYETMTFPAKPAALPPQSNCCPWTASDFEGLESRRYATSAAAAAGHAEMVAKYAAMAPPPLSKGDNTHG